MTPREEWIILLETLCGCKRSYTASGKLQSEIILPLRTKITKSFANSQTAMDLKPIGNRKFVLMRQDNITRIAAYMEVV